jgi:two-component system response regulator HydG
MSYSTVLAVDDEVEVCRILDRMLSNDHCRVQTSHFVADAVAAIEEEPFDLYVLDYKLCDGCGLDIADRVRSKGTRATFQQRSR